MMTVQGARVVANPGCYATSILVALAPLAKAGLIAPGATVSIAASSGVSGAGASPKLELLFAEITEDFRAYGVGNSHRHLFEMRDTLAKLGADCDLLTVGRNRPTKVVPCAFVARGKSLPFNQGTHSGLNPLNMQLTSAPDRDIRRCSSVV
jgi:hypothetical protein